MQWFHRLRIRVLGLLLAVTIGCVAVLSAGVGWFSIPVVGAALWAVVVTVNKASEKAATTCWSCGQKLDSEQVAAGNVICPNCGTIHDPGIFAMDQQPDVVEDMAGESEAGSDA